MANSFGEKICAFRKQRGLSQREFASLLNKRGVKVTNQAVSKWESGASLPNAIQFLIICDILDILDISGLFIGKSYDLFSGLNEEGRQRVFEYADMLRDSGKYDDPEITGPHGTRIRTLPVYDLAEAAGKGRLLDLPDYTPVEVGTEVPVSANFGVRIAGDSMEPDYHDGDVLLVSDALPEPGDVGVFVMDGMGYVKLCGHGELLSLNPAYAPIPMTEGIRPCGKVIGTLDPRLISPA